MTAIENLYSDTKIKTSTIDAVSAISHEVHLQEGYLACLSELKISNIMRI